MSQPDVKAVTPTKSVIPRTPVQRIITPIQRFLNIEASSGIVLLICTVLALVLANSPLAESFKAIWKTPISATVGSFTLAGDVGHLLINDALMTIFFFVVGLEIKREIVAGELRNPKAALLPVLGALGGVMAPALIYLALQWGQPGQRGWAVPMATDIAFVVGIMAVFGSRVPFGLKIFLLTLAIVDDLVAVLIIAAVFTETIEWAWLLAAASGFGFTMTLNRLGVRQVPIYVVVGAGIWLAFLKSGVHPTVAGVLLGLLTPSSAWLGHKALITVIEEAWNSLRGYDPETDNDALPVNLREMQLVARETISPLHRLEMGLHPWVAYVIMPIFALANAGVALKLAAVQDPVAVAVAAGLFFGKPLGICLACWVGIRLGLTQLPRGVSWGQMIAGASLAGIGFTMALFLNALSFPVADYPTQEAAGKIGTLTGSCLSAIVGSVLLVWTSRRAAAQPAAATPTPENVA